MKEKIFKKPEAIVVSFAEEDIIVTSTFDEYGGEGGLGDDN